MSQSWLSAGFARRAVPLVIVLLAGAATASAHGSQYTPPKDPGPSGPPPTQPTPVAPPSHPGTGGVNGNHPGGGGGGMSGGAGSPGGPAKPGVGAPAGAPMSGAAAGKPGGTGVVSQGSGGSGVPFTGNDPSAAESPDAWQLWWHDHEDKFLQLRVRLQPDAPASRVASLTGLGRIDHGSGRRAATAQVEEQVVPLLLELLAKDDKPEVLDSALIALGRCANEEDAERMLAAVRPRLSSAVLSVQTSAVLALGIHGSPRFVPLLGAIMADSANGRLAVGGPVPPIVRSMAALALGLGNHPTAVPLLTDLLSTLPDSQVELKSCAIAALGSTANEASNDATAALVGLLRDRRLDSPLKAQVPLALARVDNGACEEAVPALILAFSDRDQDDRVRASLAQALGQLADPRQTPALDALVAAVRKDHHVATRHAAVMALAEIGLRDAPDQAQHPEAHERIAATLEQALQDPLSYTDHPWAALACGVYARGATPQAAPLHVALLDEYHADKDPSARGACALALGLAGVTEAADPILKDFRDQGDPLLRGWSAMALGLLGVKDAREQMLSLCSSAATEPVVREQVSLGLALLEDPQTVSTLLDVLGRVQQHNVSLGVARALGRIGDREAIPELAKIASDTGRQDSTRGMAVVALGLLGERGDLPWNASLRQLRNAETPVTALQLVFDIL